MQIILTDKGKSFKERLRKKIFQGDESYGRYTSDREVAVDFDTWGLLDEIDEAMLAFPKDPEGLDSSGVPWSRSIEITPEQAAYGDTEEFSSWSDLEMHLSPRKRKMFRNLFEAGYIKVLD